MLLSAALLSPRCPRITRPCTRPQKQPSQKSPARRLRGGRNERSGTRARIGSGACRTLARETTWCQCEGSHRKQASPKNEKGHGRPCRGCGRNREERRYPRAELSAGKGCPVWHATGDGREGRSQKTRQEHHCGPQDRATGSAATVGRTPSFFEAHY